MNSKILATIVDKLNNPDKLHLRIGEQTPIAEAFGVDNKVISQLPQYLKVAIVRAVVVASA